MALPREVAAGASPAHQDKAGRSFPTRLWPRGLPGSQHHSPCEGEASETPLAECSGCTTGFGVQDQVHVGEGHRGMEAAAGPKAMLRR